MDEHSIDDDGLSSVEGSVADVDEDLIGLELSTYEEEELEIINDVMIKYKTADEEEKERKRKIHASLTSSIRTIEIKNVDSGNKFCLICGEKFLTLIVPRRVCELCDRGVCGRCLYKFHNDKTLLCELCFLNRTREGKTGKWFRSLSRESGRFRRPAPKIVLNSIRKIRSKNPTSQSRGISRGSSGNSRHTSGTPKRQAPKPPESSIIEEDILPIEGRQKLRLPEPNYDFSYSEMHQPLYSHKKNAPKPPRRSYLAREEGEIKIATSQSLEASIDVTDSALGTNKYEDFADLLNDETDDSPKYPHDDTSNIGNMSHMSASMMSVYSDAEESYKSGIQISGEISLCIFYVDAVNALRIHVDQCRNIAIVDKKKKRTDPYIKTYLLPDKTKMSKKKTSVKTMTTNPIFKENLSYYVSKEDLSSRTLSVALWHKSPLIKYNIFIGEVQLVLSDLNLESKDYIWYQFHERKKYPMRSGGLLFKGELILKLKYKPSARKDSKGSLHVCIVAAKNLVTDLKSINSYVKGYLLPDRDPKSKRKTNVCKNSANPIWNSLLIFPNVSLQELGDRSLELSVNHLNRLNINEFLGGVRINLGLGLCSSEHVQWMDSQGSEKDAWELFLSNPLDYTDTTLNLRPNLDF